MTGFDQDGQLQQPQSYGQTHNLDQQGCLRVVYEQLLRHGDPQRHVNEHHAWFEQLASRQLPSGTDDSSEVAGEHGALRTLQAMRSVDATRWLDCFLAEAEG